MKKLLLSVIGAFLLLAVLTPIANAGNWNTWDYLQKQKFTTCWKDNCYDKLLNKQWQEYMSCSLSCKAEADNYNSNQSTCKDSDAGIDYLTKGTVTTDLAVKDDYCYTFPKGKEYLMEGVCSASNKYIRYQKNCKELGTKYSCQEGACVYANNAPVFEEGWDGSEQEIDENTNATIWIGATDADGDSLTFYAENLPEGATFKKGNPPAGPLPEGVQYGGFEWQPTYDQAGEYDVTFVVSDGESEDSINLVIVVKEDPTYISGIISEDTVLSKNGNPYIVTGNILVPEGIILTLEPGVEMRFDGPYYIKVEGTLVADGTSDDEIIFTSNKDNPKPGDWGQIKFMDSSIDWDGVGGSVIRNTILEHGGSADYYPYIATVVIFDSSPLFKNNELRFYKGHGIYAEGCSSSFANSIFHDSDLIANNGYSVIFLGGSWGKVAAPLVLDNNFYNNNREYVINMNQVIDGAVVTGNQINNNNGYGIFCNSCRKAEISYNYVSNNKFGIKASNASGQSPSSGDTLVVGNQLVGNSDTGLVLGGSESSINKLVVTGNSIIGNKNNGVSFGYSTAMLDFVNNTISENNNGIYFDTIISDFSSFNSNNIFDNAQYAVKVGTPNPDSWIPPINIVTLDNNWWGTTDTSVINEQIYDFYDDFDLGKVLYEPFAMEPF